ncbi:Homeobox protein dve-1 [Acropora cervicornis]|uniref:Homeobox protein dve-1 n=1 Tax=Acropora cervicornis TaxID=6130 RepID=A0AAD9QAJ7_ACRCE|nr:Homeobox protein dve-1 [Acropora cervicornis]
METEEGCVHFNCSVHYPSFTEEGVEVQTMARGDGIELQPSTRLSSLAANVLSEMFQKQEIDGKVIMKADNAKVFIQVRDNWKPHPLADFTKGGDLEVTIHEAFGDVLFVKDSSICIHVHLCYDKDWDDQKVKTAIKKLLEHYSQTHLERMLCPFSQGMLSQISRDQYPCRLSSEKIKLFAAWYEHSQLSKEQEEDGSMSPGRKLLITPRGKKIVFNTTVEIPLLRKWYEETPKPDMKDLTRYAEILNNLEERKNREQVLARHVNTWFKNERARLRREGLLEDLSRPSMAVASS